MSQERWTGDYRSIGHVDWPDGLRERVREAQTLAFRGMCRWGSLIVALLAALFYSLWGMMTISFHYWWFVFVVVVVGVVLGTGIFLLLQFRAIPHEMRWKAARAALRNEQLERFDYSANEPAALASQDYLLIAPAGQMVVLESGLDDPTLERVVIRTVASGHAANAIRHNRLPLSGEDKGEIQDRIRENRRHARKGVISLLVIVAFVVIVVSTTTVSSPKLIALALTCPTMLLVIVLTNLNAVRLNRHLKRDLEEGFCILCDTESSVSTPEENGDKASEFPEPSPSITYCLPHSDRLWIIDGVPAPWRRFS
ncbi:MAG: hypothetical protein ACIAQF_04250 [Phycisphaerales bacterium JB065]